MTPEKKAFAGIALPSIRTALIRVMIQLHHAPSLEQTVEDYLTGVRPSTELPSTRTRQEPTLLFMQATIPVVADILAQCYDPDREKMLVNLEAQPDLLSRLPLITDFMGHGGGGSA